MLPLLKVTSTKNMITSENAVFKTYFTIFFNSTKKVKVRSGEIFHFSIFHIVTLPVPILGEERKLT